MKKIHPYAVQYQVKTVNEKDKDEEYFSNRSELLKQYKLVRKKFRKKVVPKSLAAFQALEQVLKQVIYDNELVIRRLLKEKLLYIPRDFDEIDRYSLNKLLEEYARYSDNHELLSQIKGLVKIRNRVAHESYIHIYSNRPITDSEDLILEPVLFELKKSYKELKRCTKITNKCSARIQDEWHKSHPLKPNSTMLNEN